MGRGGRRQRHDGVGELLGAGYGLARGRPVALRRRAGVACRAHLLCPGQLHHARPSAAVRGVGGPCSFRGADGGQRNAAGRRRLGVRGRTRAAILCSCPAGSSEAPGRCAGTWRPHQRHRAAAGQAANASAEHRGDSTAPRRAVRRDREEDDGPGARHSGVRCRWISGRRHRDSRRSARCTARRGAVAGWRDSGRAGGDCRSDRFRGRPARCTCHAGRGYPGERRCSGARRRGEGTLGALVGLVGGPPPGLPAPRRLPAARAPGSSRSTDSICQPQPPPPQRELCWGVSSIFWRAVPDGGESRRAIRARGWCCREYGRLRGSSWVAPRRRCRCQGRRRQWNPRVGEDRR